VSENTKQALEALEKVIGEVRNERLDLQEEENALIKAHAILKERAEMEEEG
jgi:hypothetical protein